jgi:hypothetical protein
VAPSVSRAGADRGIAAAIRNAVDDLQLLRRDRGRPGVLDLFLGCAEIGAPIG